MKILAIETSCDETSVAILEARGGLQNPRFKVLSNIVSSQVKLHAQFGGVVPSLAARKHQENLPRVFRLAFNHAGLKLAKNSIDLVVVTKGPGLMPALLQGVAFAKQVADTWSKPLLGVNHLEGHLLSNWLGPAKESFKFPLSKTQIFPALVLIVSGGHTELVLMKDYGRYQLLGQTKDDAAGECFDKGARLLNLGYPGGPALDKLARQGNANYHVFPSPLIHSKDLDFSYSGLKTSLLYFLQKNRLDFSSKKITARQEQLRADITASFQKALVEVLVKKTLRAADLQRVKTIFVGGGVAANSYLQKRMEQTVRGAKGRFRLFFPLRSYITDNAAMIGVAGYFAWLAKRRDERKSLDADANLPLAG